MTAPMTAAEYREVAPGIKELTPFGKRTLAALEEREALLKQVAKAADDFKAWSIIAGKTITDGTAEIARLTARVAELEGAAAAWALVQKIDRHPAADNPAIVSGQRGTLLSSLLTTAGLESHLSHLDSLLPKEPEWSEFAPSNRQYRLDGDALFMRWGDKPGERVWREYAVPLSDVPVVAALMAKGGKDD